MGAGSEPDERYGWCVPEILDLTNNSILKGLWSMLDGHSSLGKMRYSWG